LHHTGHDAGKSFGTKTREWEMDTVISLSIAEDDQGVVMDFKKARLCTPRTVDQFKSRVIVRNETGWTVVGDISKVKTADKQNIGRLRIALLDAYDRLADGVATSAGLDGAPVCKVRVDALRNELKARGFLEVKETGGLTATARSNFHRAKMDLLSTGRLFELDGQIWK
jgi:hypothetical protein